VEEDTMFGEEFSHHPHRCVSKHFPVTPCNHFSCPNLSLWTPGKSARGGQKGGGVVERPCLFH